MTNFGTVMYNENMLLVHPAVMKQMGLRKMQSVTEPQLWEIIARNAAVLVADMDQRRLSGEKNIPNTTELKQTLDKLGHQQ